jgi:hypothetical protein
VTAALWKKNCGVPHSWNKSERKCIEWKVWTVPVSLETFYRGVLHFKTAARPRPYIWPQNVPTWPRSQPLSFMHSMENIFVFCSSPSPSLSPPLSPPSHSPVHAGR